MNVISELLQLLVDPRNPDTEDFTIFVQDQLQPYHHYRFWFHVLQDHMIFIIKRSSSYAQTANIFRDRLTKLKQLILDGFDKLDSDNFDYFNEQVIVLVEEIRDFKRQILSDLLNGPPKITLPPTFISHMLNELERFRYIIHYMKVNRHFPLENNLNAHDLWLQDIMGHLLAIKDNLDPVEKIFRKRLGKECKIFKMLHDKTLEFIGYFKHDIVPANNVNALDSESMKATILYCNLVKEILFLRSNNIALGVVDAHMLSHMIFEEIYYLKCLENSQPNYDPLVTTQIKLDKNSFATIEDIHKYSA